MERIEERVPDLVPLRRMATQAGVPAKWLRVRAEAGEVPALRAGKRWLFIAPLVMESLVALSARQKGGERC